MSTCQALELLLFDHSVMSNSATPVDCSTPGFPVLYYLLELAQTHVYLVSDGIQPSHPLSPPFPFAFSLSQHQGLLQWARFSHQVAKVLELQHRSLQWIFRVDFLQDWLAYCAQLYVCEIIIRGKSIGTESHLVVTRSWKEERMESYCLVYMGFC